MVFDIQALTAVNLTPIIAVLALESKISTEAGTILGAVAGFLLWSLRDSEESKK